MKTGFTRILCSLFFLPILVLSQNKIDLKADFDVEKNQIKIAQTITYFNTSEDTLEDIYLNDWSHSFATKTTPLAKRFAEEYNTAFHFAKNSDRGFSVITSIHQNEKELTFERLKNQLDIVKITLNKPLKPKESYTITLNYIVQIPNDKFTRYGTTSKGDIKLRYWYITPAVYNGEWQYFSNKNLGDLLIPNADLSLELNIPNNFYVTTELDELSSIKKDSISTYKLQGKNRTNNKNNQIKLDAINKLFMNMSIGLGNSLKKWR